MASTPRDRELLSYKNAGSGTIAALLFLDANKEDNMLRLITVVAVLFLAGSAQASVIYEFTTTDYTVSDPGGDFDGISLTMELSDGVYEAGFLRTPSTSPMPACLVGDILGFAVNGRPVTLCPDDPTTLYEQLLVDLDLQFVGTSLTGSFAAVWLSGSEAVFLDSQPSGLWSGQYGSDNAELGCWFEPCPIEGEWRLVSGPTPVPGPPSLALLVAGLAGIALAGRRPHDRTKGSAGGAATSITARCLMIGSMRA